MCTAVIRLHPARLTASVCATARPLVVTVCLRIRTSQVKPLRRILSGQTSWRTSDLRARRPCKQAWAPGPCAAWLRSRALERMHLCAASARVCACLGFGACVVALWGWFRPWRMRLPPLFLLPGSGCHSERGRHACLACLRSVLAALCAVTVWIMLVTVWITVLDYVFWVGGSGALSW